MSDLTQQIMLKQVLSLTEVIDKSIKAMKSSMEYQGQENLLVERFASLLLPYYNLMTKWMMNIPEQYYEQCTAKISRDSEYNSKDKMLEAISSGFHSMQQEREIKQLNPSGYLSVASVKLGSNASFE